MEPAQANAEFCLSWNPRPQEQTQGRRHRIFHLWGELATAPCHRANPKANDRAVLLLPWLHCPPQETEEPAPTKEHCHFTKGLAEEMLHESKMVAPTGSTPFIDQTRLPIQDECDWDRYHPGDLPSSLHASTPRKTAHSGGIT